MVAGTFGRPFVVVVLVFIRSGLVRGITRGSPLPCPTKRPPSAPQRPPASTPQTRLRNLARTRVLRRVYVDLPLRPGDYPYDPETTLALSPVPRAPSPEP